MIAVQTALTKEETRVWSTHHPKSMFLNFVIRNMLLLLKHTSFYHGDFNEEELLSEREIFLNSIKRKVAEISNLKAVVT